jgi:hypothetical protein
VRTLTALAVLFLTPALMAAVTPPATAQPAPTEHVRGQITAADDTSITVKTPTGSTVRLVFASDLSVTSLMKADFSEVKVGSYVGGAGVPILPAPRTCLGSGCKEPKVTLLALQIYPETMKGAGEGQRAWDLAPNSKITNGTVEDVDGRVLSLTFKGNDLDVYVPTKAPIVKIGPGDKALLKPGAHVFAVARKGSDGNLTAIGVSVGKDGLVPPM